MLKHLTTHENPDVGLLLIRIGLAVVFIVHGYLKLTNIEGTTEFFGSIGLPAIFVWLVALVELVGGLALLTGKYVCYAGWALAIVMFFAIILVKWPLGFVGGYEYELVLLLASLGLAYTGAGKYRLLEAKKS